MNEPQTYEEAEQFLRRDTDGIVTRQILDKDSDWFDITVKGIDEFGHEVTYRQLSEIKLNGRSSVSEEKSDLYKERVVTVAKACFRVFTSLSRHPYQKQ